MGELAVLGLVGGAPGGGYISLLQPLACNTLARDQKRRVSRTKVGYALIGRCELRSYYVARYLSDQ